MLSGLSATQWRQSFVVGVAALLLMTLVINAVWWLTISAFGSLFVLNLHFILFPNTAERQGLNHLSMGLAFSLFVIANIKFFIITALV